jgi:hypothetical protein
MSDFWEHYGTAICIILFFSLLFGGGIGGLIFATFSTSTNWDNANSQAKHDLEIQGYTIVKGIINSPTVIEVTDNYNFFINHTPRNIQIYEISRSSPFIAIFNMSYGLAYQPQYKTSAWWIW